MDELEINANIGDLVIYHDDNSLFVAKVLKFVEYPETDFKYKIVVRDFIILRQNQDEHVLEDNYEIYFTDIVKNCGNITIAEFEENYPEWTI